MKDADSLPMTPSPWALGSGLWLWALGWERIIAFEVLMIGKKRGIGLDGEHGW